jgi:hypothetical protein
MVSAKEQKVTKLREVVAELERRAASRGIQIQRDRFPGSKRDLQRLLERALGQRISEASLEEYKRELGIKFPPGNRASDLLRQLFPDAF